MISREAHSPKAVSPETSSNLKSVNVAVSNGSKQQPDKGEWVVQVVPGAYITLAALPSGGNELRRIRFRYGQIYQLVCTSCIDKYLLRQYFRGYGGYLQFSFTYDVVIYSSTAENISVRIKLRNGGLLMKRESTSGIRYEVQSAVSSLKKSQVLSGLRSQWPSSFPLETVHVRFPHPVESYTL